jgi:outer membrane receptor protein involved in Fe transport
VIVTGSGTAGNTRTFVNADSGEVYGVELDVRREFGLNDALTRTFFVYGNYSWIESSVDDKNGDGDRSLQGQPDYTVNLVIGLDDINTNQELTLLLNQSGDTIVDVAPFGQPDIVQEPTLSVDLNYKWYFADDWQFDLKGKNLLNDEIKYTQGGQLWREYKTGRVYEVGFNWSF